MNEKLVNTMHHLYKELEEMANFIHSAKEEISQVGKTEIKETHIANATDQLDAIIISTDEASNQIMEAAEDIEEIASSLDNEVENKITEAVTKIFEACSFQDLTGQRITKVVEALQNIEKKVESLVETFENECGFIENSPTNTENKQASQISDEKSKQDKEKELLNGPQHPDKTPTQEEIDSLFDK